MNYKLNGVSNGKETSQKRQGLLIALMFIIFSCGFALWGATSPQGKVKKISYAAFSESPQFLACKITRLVYHFKYNSDSTNIIQVIDSVYIREGR